MGSKYCTYISVQIFLANVDRCAVSSISSLQRGDVESGQLVLDRGNLLAADSPGGIQSSA